MNVKNRKEEKQKNKKEKFIEWKPKNIKHYVRYGGFHE